MRMRTWLPRPATVLGCVLALLATDARASVVVELDLPGLVQNAERVVVGRVATAVAEQTDGRIITRARVVVSETLKGATATEIVVVSPGGEVGALGQWVPGAPRLAAGDEVLLFLEPRPLVATRNAPLPTVTRAAPEFQVVGLAQGLYRVTLDPTMRAKVAAPELAGLSLVRPRPDGSLPSPAPAPRVAPVPLDTLRARIRAALGSEAAR